MAVRASRSPSHWLAAREGPRALDALLRALDELAGACTPIATRPAPRRRALELWPDGEREGERIALLERYARSAELAGDLAEATRALARGGGGASRGGRRARARRRPATPGLDLRAAAATASVRSPRGAWRPIRSPTNGLPGEAAAERLVVAGYLQSAGKHGEAVALARVAAARRPSGPSASTCAPAPWASRAWRRPRAASSPPASRRSAPASRSRWPMSLTPEAAELYQRLGTALETAGDYGGAREALTTAVGLCRTGGADALEQVCLSCVAYVLRELGDWDASVELCHELQRRRRPSRRHLGGRRRPRRHPRLPR